MKEIAAQIKAQFLEMGVELQLSEIEEKLDTFINKFKVHPIIARRSVIKILLQEHSIPKYPKNWISLKHLVYKKANYQCKYCGKRGLGLNAHHLKHISEGGSNDLDNLVCLCDECHSLIHPKNKILIHKYYSNFKNYNYMHFV